MQPQDLVLAYKSSVEPFGSVPHKRSTATFVKMKESAGGNLDLRDCILHCADPRKSGTKFSTVGKPLTHFEHSNNTPVSFTEGKSTYQRQLSTPVRF
jgi:hypothetical protein